MHWHCSSYPTGKGALAQQPGDPPTLSFAGISMGSSFERYSPLKRVRQEVAYGRSLGRLLEQVRPDVALICNTPLLAHGIAATYCNRRSIPMVFWHQDIYSAAIAEAASKRLGPLGRPIGKLADRLERYIARSSRAIIPISTQFRAVLSRWGVSERSTVIPNWAPLEEIPVKSRENDWARRHDLVGRPTVLYSGTLGLKHDPAILLELARAMGLALPSGRVVVVSEGRGRDWLAEQQSAASVENLVLMDYQPYIDFPKVLASGDVLIAILEPAAGHYSVPSKLLSYLCSGRPIVAVIPTENAAASTLRASGAGTVVDASNRSQAVTEVLDLLCDDVLRQKMGIAGRAYADATFDISAIGAKFERILLKSARSR
jgi:colanic acid biosynthesis glycosyl transferase WcaI